MFISMNMYSVVQVVIYNGERMSFHQENVE